MKKWIVSLTMLVAGIVLGLLISVKVSRAVPTQAATFSAGPTLESVQALASLVTTKVTVSDVQLTCLQGYTGAAKAALLVRGDFTTGTDLSRANFSSVDAKAKSVVVTLQEPTPGSPWVDLSRTRLVALDTEGLWDVVPGHAVEQVVTDDAYRSAQETVLRISRERQWQDQARQQAESVLQRFFGSIGWGVEIRWSDP